MFTQSCIKENYALTTCLHSLVQRRITPKHVYTVLYKGELSPKHVYTVLYKGELPLNMFTQSCTKENYP